MKYTKVFNKYYFKWYRDCHDSIIYCKERNMPDKANEYLNKANNYFNLINENWYEILGINHD